MDQKDSIVFFLKSLRDEVIASFEQLEKDRSKKFKKKKWDYSEEGGGEISLLRGSVFEKAAVNWSGIRGAKFPMKDGEGAFFATGVSLITHMKNPHAPTAHMNVRYIETETGYWFGGGYDLTPMGFPYEEDRDHFHQSAKTALDRFDPSLYPQFSEEARRYFFIPHRQKERGVGGIFFDHLNTGNFKNDFDLWKGIAHSFLPAILPIYEKRIEIPYTRKNREEQLRLRGHYVEFNLLYDRGTQFGFRSGGNPDAILCSMPPIVKW